MLLRETVRHRQRRLSRKLPVLLSPIPLSPCPCTPASLTARLAPTAARAGPQLRSPHERPAAVSLRSAETSRAAPPSTQDRRARPATGPPVLEAHMTPIGRRSSQNCHQNSPNGESGYEGRREVFGCFNGTLIVVFLCQVILELSLI